MRRGVQAIQSQRSVKPHKSERMKRQHCHPHPPTKIIFYFQLHSAMKLATYKDGSRDGQLVVVSRDLTLAHYATGIANTMQAVLDDWNFMSPQLEDLFVSLNQGRARHSFPFDAARCMAPLPRIYQWIAKEGKRLVLRSGGDDFESSPLAFLTSGSTRGASQAELRDALRLAVQSSALAVTLDELGDSDKALA